MSTNQKMDFLKDKQLLEHRLTIEKTISSISSMFVSTENIDESINVSLGLIGSLCKADRAYLFEIRENEKIMDNTHEWCAEGVECQKENLQALPMDMFPWWMQKMHRREIIHIADLSDLPPEASAEKGILEIQEIKSLIVLPVTLEGTNFGFIGMDNVDEIGEWHENDIAILQTLANIISKGIENKRKEDELEASEAKFRSYVENALDGIFVADEKGNYVDINKAACEITGYSKEELLSMNLFDLIPVEEHEIAAKSFGNVVQNGYTKEVSHINRKDGTQLIWTIEAIKLSDNRFLAFTKDITKEKQAEETLIKTETRLKSLYESMTEGLCLHELVYDNFGKPIDYKIIDTNPSYEKILGLRKAEVINKLASEIYRADYPPYLDIYADVVRTEEAHKFESYFAPLDKYFSISAFCSGQNQFATLFSDITEKKMQRLI